MARLTLVGVGSILGIITCDLLVDRLYVKLRKRHGNKIYPEGRLPLVVFGAFTLPSIIALYGWSAAAHLPVAVLLLAVVLMGFAMMCSMVPMLTYVTDAFELYSASALTAVLVTRCLAGTFLPLATSPLTD
ncbi:hypothetical protein LTR37_017440 [Vermiconidia calcicola]|uniref:Uncharacterized protein n=1 Tax=Vermiconidia calcicola TaxID=1690605 RepID=A0ACC3MKU1_9PEZI|nr:hypothetical protein LTR37_017440 [Vermiconidia calcicola]